MARRSRRLRAFLDGIREPARRPRPAHPLQRPRWSLPGLTARPWHRAAGFSWTRTLAPRTRIRAHCGPTNLRLRCHLPLIAPPGAELKVAGEARAWTEGRCVVFDDSFEHEAWNPTARWRVVLLVDFWHPELTQGERRALAELVAREPAARPAAQEAPRDLAWEVGAAAAFASGRSRPG